MEEYKKPGKRAQCLLCKINGKNNFVLIGGANREEHFGDAWLFQIDPIENHHKFLRLNTSTLPRSGHAGGIDENYNIFWFGGQNVHAGQLYNDIGMLNHSTLTCTDLNYAEANTGKIIPLARNSHCFCYDYQGKQFILFGGACSTGDLNDVFCFNPGTREWKKKESMSGSLWPLAREMHIAHAYISHEDSKSHLIVCGGRTSEGSICKEIWDYDIEKNIWKQKKDCPLPLAAMASTIYKDRYIFIYGGTNGLEFLNDLWMYDIKDEKWTKLHAEKYIKNPAGKITASMCSAEDFILIYGGCGIANEFSDIEIIHLKDLQKEENIQL